MKRSRRSGTNGRAPLSLRTAGCAFLSNISGRKSPDRGQRVPAVRLDPPVAAAFTRRSLKRERCRCAGPLVMSGSTVMDRVRWRLVVLLSRSLPVYPSSLACQVRQCFCCYFERDDCSSLVLPQTYIKGPTINSRGQVDEKARQSDSYQRSIVGLTRHGMRICRDA